MKQSIAIGALAFFLSFSSLAGTQQISCVLAGDALDTLEFTVDNTSETILVEYSFMSGETVEFVSERESSLFSNNKLSMSEINFVAFNGDSFSFGGAHFQSALVIMKEVNDSGYRDVLVSAAGTVYTGNCK